MIKHVPGRDQIENETETDRGLTETLRETERGIEGAGEEEKDRDRVMEEQRKRERNRGLRVCHSQRNRGGEADGEREIAEQKKRRRN